jgi:single-strand DNA-binding protein
MLNNVILIGRTVEDLEVITTENGLKTCKMVLACQRPFKNQETQEYDTDFIPIQLWQVVAEMTAQNCKKGSTVAVKARLATRITEVNGTKIKMIDVIGERVIYINTKKE